MQLGQQSKNSAFFALAKFLTTGHPNIIQKTAKPKEATMGMTVYEGRWPIHLIFPPTV